MTRPLLLLPLLLAACATPAPSVTDVAVADLPPEVVAALRAAEPQIAIEGAQLKLREGRRYYDVEGTVPGRGEIELDLLLTPAGWRVVEIQRNIAWADAPAAVRAAAPNAAPVRVIESRQTDGSVVYELFAPGRPATPALEVMLRDGAATVLREAWPH